jgi:GTP-binding protein
MGSAHVAVLVADAADALTKQDLVIATHAREQGRGVVLLLNKADAVTDMASKEKSVSAAISRKLPEFGKLPCISLSAKTGRNVDGVIPAV